MFGHPMEKECLYFIVISYLGSNRIWRHKSFHGINPIKRKGLSVQMCRRKIRDHITESLKNYP